MLLFKLEQIICTKKRSFANTKVTKDYFLVVLKERSIWLCRDKNSIK
jgi:hypothetical protein